MTLTPIRLATFAKDVKSTRGGTAGKFIAISPEASHEYGTDRFSPSTIEAASQTGIREKRKAPGRLAGNV
jgi:hypothetical protein